MEDWVYRALAKWPNVPALFGWLSLDRRGRWRIRGEVITRPQIIDTINPNYASDEHGRWYFQNGPQRGYVKLMSAPLILRADDNGALVTHTGHPVEHALAAYLDEHGGLLLQTDHGPAALADNDLEWALQHLRVGDVAIDEQQLAAALTLPSGRPTASHLRLGATRLPVARLDFTAAPAALSFVRDPQPLPSEKTN
jgi:hypothetical protein